jgi:hypothetical protein
MEYNIFYKLSKIEKSKKKISPAPETIIVPKRKSSLEYYHDYYSIINYNNYTYYNMNDETESEIDIDYIINMYL